MAVRMMSVRYWRWLAGRSLVRAWPPLNRRVIFYNQVQSAESAGSAQLLESSEDLSFSDYERGLVDRLPRSVAWQEIPARLERRRALIAMDGATVLGNTGAVVDETRQCLLALKGTRSFVTYHDFRPEPLEPVNRTGQPTMTMVGSWKGHRHLFHFMFDRLPKLYYALERFGLKDGRLEVLTNEDLPGFQKDFYRFLCARYPGLTVTPVPARERWRFDQLHTVDLWQNTKSTLCEEGLLDFVRGLYLDGYGITLPKKRRRLWISREDTKKRRIANEAELQPILERFGFETVMPGRLPFPEQVALFAEAEAVAGTHGAGLTNLLFSPRDTRVLELFPENKLRNTYFLLSRSLGQPYRYLIAGAGGVRERYRVEPKAFEESLSALLDKA